MTRVRLGRLGSAVAGCLLAAGAVTALIPAPTAAHALLVSSDPKAGANLPSAPASVTITFTETPDPRLSAIKVLDASGASMTQGPTRAVPGKPKELTVALKKLPNGVYTVSWRTLSTVDGHLAAGSFAFGVGSAPPSATTAASGSVQSSGSSPLSPAAVAGRWLLYLGLIVALGCAFIAVVIYAAPPLRSGTVMLGAWLAIAAGTATVIGVQVSQSGVGILDALGSSIGPAALLRAVPVAIGLVLALLGWRRGLLRSRRLLAVLGVLAALGMLSDALVSHAAAGSLVPVEVALQWIHIAAAGTWLGGLFALLISLPGTPGEVSGRAARRFALSATVGIALVAGTGALRAVAELGSVQALFDNGFGLVILAKSALLLLLAGLGAVNHFRHVPRADRSLRGLRAFGTTELAIGVVLLVLSGTLVNLAPPVQASGASPSPSPALLAVSGHDFGTTTKARLEVSPGTTGFNTFRLVLTDYDSGKALTGRDVSLRFALPARPDVGDSQLQLAESDPGVYTATGANLSIDGDWRVTAQIAGGSPAVEVAMQLRAASAQPSMDITRTEGLPTLYTVHLAAGNSVQVYLDPGAPGANELHVTFFDPAGNELPVPSVQLGLGAASSAPAPLTPRMLEPGHFVADVTVKAGDYRVSIAGTPPSGSPLTTEFTLTVGT